MWPLAVADSLERGLAAAARLGDVIVVVFDVPLAAESVVRPTRQFAHCFRHIAFVDENEARLVALREACQKSAGCCLQ